MRKKFLSFAVAVCIATICAVNAAAADFAYGSPTGTETPPDDSTVGTITVNAGVSNDDVVHKYAVSFEGADATFTYTFAGMSWNPTTHKYDKASESAENGWGAANTAEFTVENHSDLPIVISATEQVDEQMGGNVGFDTKFNGQDTHKLEKCEPNTDPTTGAPSVDGVITISGTPAVQDTTAAAKIGTVTVIINPVS